MLRRHAFVPRLIGRKGMGQSIKLNLWVQKLNNEIWQGKHSAGGSFVLPVNSTRRAGRKRSSRDTWLLRLATKQPYSTMAFCLSHTQKKTVIELGAGCALPSLLLATVAEPPSLVVVTDYPDDMILGNLQRNVKRNLEHYTYGCNVLCLGYEWGKDVGALL